MELSIKYQYFWIWRFLITWSMPEFEIGFYDVDCETELFCIIFRRWGLLSRISKWFGTIAHH